MQTRPKRSQTKRQQQCTHAIEWASGAFEHGKYAVSGLTSMLSHGPTGHCSITPMEYGLPRGSHDSKAWFGSYSSCGPGVIGSIIVRSVIGGDHRRSVPSDGSMHCLAANCREQQICLSRNERTSSLTGKALSDSPAYRCCYLQMSAEAQVRAES